VEDNGNIIFITGTDTGVGKTTLTTLLLAHLMSSGQDVRAAKPFSSGDRGDELLIRALQGDSHAVNLFHFETPIAPWSAARRAGVQIEEDVVLKWLRRQSALTDFLLIEGAGGLLTPLGEELDAAQLIQKLQARAIVVAQNRLGVLNQTMLALSALCWRGISDIQVVLIDTPVDGALDSSKDTNLDDLNVLAKNAGVPVFRLPFLSGNLRDSEFIRRSAASLADVLQALAAKKNPPDTDPRGLFP
jgi:dethiobiotin synthetase